MIRRAPGAWVARAAALLLVAATTRDNDRIPFPGRTGQRFDRLHRTGLLALRCGR